MDHVLNKTLLAHPFGIDFDGRIQSDVDFADDVALVCENLNALETLTSAASISLRHQNCPGAASICCRKTWFKRKLDKDQNIASG